MFPSDLVQEQESKTIKKSATKALEAGQRYIYVVYDPEATDQESAQQLAFIEQRFENSRTPARQVTNEKHFKTLREAKIFVRNNFALGAEYFSSKQLSNPDNVFYTLADKLAYFMA
ncbi:hypothetical protein [Dyadobacter luticola]|uniref:Uncharacterized protein n=1 Tax=Dyadobacter luticola TaxID=1979387 RepID=A0A5R9L690_9BACT|nr:hypothetical protein [Dyadobacter luticola]TLV03931.1 hypothetical protein FEN17_10200 [Dyadobacter luticola]